ncbi:hypothetical protein TFLX_03994 [Thermoflexales bacterium]|nr:hypothetical protein TFLX_03994 [Thermoflexales bacterium]
MIVILPEDLATHDIVLDTISSPVLVIEPPASDQTMTVILPCEIAEPKPNYVISVGDLITATIVREPLDGAQVGLHPVAIRGEAEPNSVLALEVGGFRAETRAVPDGVFVFEGVQLHDGWNDIRIESVTYPGFARCQAAIQIYRQEHPLLFVGRIDPYSRSYMTAQDDVVRCRRCGNFARLDSWMALPGCPIWECGNRNVTAHWTHDDPEFYKDESGLDL